MLYCCKLMMPSNQILSNICKSIKIVIYLQYHNICQQSSCWHSQCGNMLKEEKYCENSENWGIYDNYQSHPKNFCNAVMHFHIFSLFFRENMTRCFKGSSARQRIHMKNQALFSSKGKSKKLKYCLLQFFVCTLRVKCKLTQKINHRSHVHLNHC